MTNSGTKKYLNTAGLTEYFADFRQNTFATLFYTPKIIHNLILKHGKPVSDFIGLGKAFDLLGAGLNLIFNDKEAKGRDWYSNYFLFGTWINALKFLRATPDFPIFGKHLWGGIVGGLIQGFDDCPAQERLGGKYPITAAAVGFANGVMCCFLQSAAISFFSSYLSVPKGADFALGFIATWAMSSKLMCTIAQAAFKVAEKTMPSKEKHIPTADCCCNAKAQPPTINPSTSTKHADTELSRRATNLGISPAAAR